jgi:hypothetical protein
LGQIVDITSDGLSNAFPGLCETADGALLVAYRKSTGHNPPPASSPGVLVVRKSTDGGSTWSAETTIYSAPTGYEARDPNLTLLSDGRIACAFFDYKDATDYTGYVIYSSDDGASFSGKVALNSGMTAEAVCGPIVELANGDLLAAVYGFDGADTRSSSMIVKSTDDGATWAYLATVGDGQADSRDYDEPGLLLLANGELLCFIRVTSSSSIRAAKSTDDGATWTAITTLFGGDSRCASVLLDNGCIAVSYRGASNYGSMRFCWSDPMIANNWTTPIVFDEGFRFAYGAFSEVTPNLAAHVWAMEETGPVDADLKINYLYPLEGFDPLA